MCVHTCLLLEYAGPCACMLACYFFPECVHTWLLLEYTRSLGVYKQVRTHRDQCTIVGSIYLEGSTSTLGRPYVCTCLLLDPY